MLKIRKSLIAPIAICLLTLTLTACVPTTDDAPTGPDGNYIGVVEVHGDIGPTSDDLFSVSSVEYNHDNVMNFIDEMMTDDSNKGIFLSLDTPGGTVYESDELYLKLMQYKEETGRPIYAYMHSMAASGGYYVAMAADEIYANRNTVTGSIGVIMSGVELSGLYEKLGVKEINIASGPNKAMGSAGTPMTDEQIAIYQSHVDESYDRFVDIIVEGRQLDEATVREIADGRIYTAQQALDLDLIDGIDVSEAYMNKVLESFDDVDFYTPEEPAEDFMTVLFSKINTIVPKSDAQLLKEFCESNDQLVPMYHYGQ